MNLNKWTWWLLIVGGLNWGLESLGTGLADFLPMGLTRLVYAAVGLSALYQLFRKK
jgi:uncharacterized membrane protein YuzA (DUF378 family)